MIQLLARPAPVELTAEIVAELTQLFKKTGNSVWKQSYIERELMLLSNRKCCYCECKLGIEDKYMEVEHFLLKSVFPDEVVKWSNLLPSCRRCNGEKRIHNAQLLPIVHPVRDKPSVHLKLSAYRFYQKTAIGQTTISVLDLNDRERLTTVRATLGFKLIERLEHLEDLVQEYSSGSSISTRRKNIIINTFRQILIECTPSTEYSATAATVVLQETTYQTIKSIFQKQGFWNEEFEKLEQEALNCCLN
jgi:hypothetical protein